MRAAGDRLSHSLGPLLERQQPPLLHPAAGDHVLEVGCGWGSFAMRAAQRTGCRITGITVSKEQLAEATARVKAAGLADRVTLLFCDYRECPGAGSYDKVGHDAGLPGGWGGSVAGGRAAGWERRDESRAGQPSLVVLMPPAGLSSAPADRSWLNFPAAGGVL